MHVFDSLWEHAKQALDMFMSSRGLASHFSAVLIAFFSKYHFLCLFFQREKVKEWKLIKYFCGGIEAIDKMLFSTEINYSYLSERAEELVLIS